MDEDIFSGLNASSRFDDPFLLPSSEYIPTSLDEIFDYCFFLHHMNKLYAHAWDRLISHFITEIDVEEGDEETRKSIESYFMHKLRIFNIFKEVGLDFACYGNSFIRINTPFTRVLIENLGNGKKRFWSIDSIKKLGDVSFNTKKMQYTIRGKRDTMHLDFFDIPSHDKDNIKLRRINPRNIIINHSEVSGESEYIWDFPQNLRKKINDGEIFHINETPRKMIEAIKDNKCFKFNRNDIFHFRAPSVSGVSENNWGLPEPISNFNILFQLRVYDKIDESVGLDYLLPFRYFSMMGNEAGSSGVSSQSGIDGLIFKEQVQSAVANYRKDKFTIHAFPYQMQYDEAGGSGKSLTPKDLIEYQQNTMLDSIGYPSELFRGTYSIQQMPTAIRLFEKNFWYIYENFNNLLRWANERVYNYAGEEHKEVSLKRPPEADNIDKQNIKLQLGMSGLLPYDEFFDDVGISNPMEAIKRRQKQELDLQINQEKITAEAQRRIEAEQALSGEGSGGESGGGGPSGGQTPTDIEEEAMQKAQEWLSIESDGERTKAMNATKAQNYNLYALAKQILEEMRSEGESQGRQMVNQQGGV